MKIVLEDAEGTVMPGAVCDVSARGHWAPHHRNFLGMLLSTAADTMSSVSTARSFQTILESRTPLPE